MPATRSTAPAIAGTVDLVWVCNKGPQRELMFGALGRVREIGWGGAKGGGKSAVIGPKALQHVSEHPVHARVLILRETYGDLSDLMEQMDPQCRAAGGVFNKSEKVWRFPEGATIRFGHLERGIARYWGKEYTLIVVDEVTRCIKTEADYLKLLLSLRNPHGINGQCITLTNPGGPGHVWWKARFLGVPPRTIQRDEKGLERVFIPARLSDNPHLDNDSPEGQVYRATLEQLPDAEKAAFLDGDWDAFEGEVFKLVRGVHTWTWVQFRERTGLDAIPESWHRYLTYDHGFAKPGAAYWHAVAHNQRAFVYREYYTIAVNGKREPIPNEGARIEPRKVAANIAEKSKGETFMGRWTGPDLFYEVRQDQAGGVKISTHFEAEGIHFRAWKADDGSRLAGKQALHQRMALADDGWPMIIFIEEECPHAIRTIPALPRDPHDPELWDTDAEDHAADSIMGFCKMNPLPPIERTLTVRQQLDALAGQQNGGGTWMAR